MLEQLQTWWQNTGPETQAYIQEGSWLIAGLVGGFIIGSIVARFLRARNFDGALRLASASSGGAEHGFTPTFFAGMLVRLTVWTAVASWFAHRHGHDELASTLGMIINRTWALAAILVTALTVGSLLARRVMDCLHGLPKGEAWPARNGASASRWDLASAVGAGVYLLAILLALLFAVDVFDWPLTRTSAMALWQFAQNLLIAVAALFIGSLGARWARDLMSSDGAASPEKSV